MQMLSIGVNEYTNDSINYLVNELNNLEQKKFKIKTTLVDSPQSKVIICKLIENRIISALTDRKFNAFKQYASFILSDYIIRFYEKKLLSRIINMNYCYFNRSEKRQILDLTSSLLKPVGDETKLSIYTTKRKNLIIKKLLEYLENNNEIILDGFINFRAREYTRELEEVVDKAVDAFLMEREYQEFIKLLRYFVDIQVPKLESVHILSGYDSKYVIRDHLQNDITNECIKEFLNEVPDESINYDDLLVSSLITIAPLRIYIHCANQITNKELLNTIKSVFLNRVIICNGCSICRGNKVELNNMTKQGMQ